MCAGLLRRDGSRMSCPAPPPRECPAVCPAPPLAVNRASVSQHGPLILGFNDVLTNVAMVAGAAVALHQQGSTNISGFLGVSVVSVWVDDKYTVRTGVVYWVWGRKACHYMTPGLSQVAVGWRVLSAHQLPPRMAGNPLPTLLRASPCQRHHCILLPTCAGPAGGRHVLPGLAAPPQPAVSHIPLPPPAATRPAGHAAAPAQGLAVWAGADDIGEPGLGTSWIFLLFVAGETHVVLPC